MISLVLLLLGAFFVMEDEPPVWNPGSHTTAHSMESAMPDTGTYVDSRDGQSYRWVLIGDQVWMAENLRFVADEGSWCWEDDPELCSVRGRYYTWEAATAAAPHGWHLPSDEEWKVLERFIGLSAAEIEMEGGRGAESGEVGGKLKAKGHWPTEFQGRSIVVTDEAGYSAIPAGVYALGEFTHDGYAIWWTSTEDGDEAWIRVLRMFDNRIDRVRNSKAHAFTIRCVRDEGEQTGTTGGDDKGPGG